MNEHALLAEHFEEHRPHLKAVAYRMLGSRSDADDAVQEAWLRVSRADSKGLNTQREVVDAFLAASREGDFAALIALLDPDVVLRTDGGAVLAGGSRLVRGAPAVAEQSVTFARSGAGQAQPALVNGAAELVLVWRGRPFSVVGFTVRRGRIVEIDVLADPARLRQLQLDALDARPRRAGNTEGPS